MGTSTGPMRRAVVGGRLTAGTMVLVLALGAAASGAELEFYQALRIDQFLMEALLHVHVADFTGNGRAEVLLSGRNYEARERYLYLVRWRGNGFETIWRSANLHEPASHLTVAVGRFTGGKAIEVAVASQSAMRLLRWDGRQLATFWEGPTPFQEVGEMAAATHPDFPADLLVATRVEELGLAAATKSLSLYAWRGDGFHKVLVTDAIGRVRAVAAGDVTGDGLAELVVEEGMGTAPGTVQVWAWDGQAYRPIRAEALRAAPVFALAVGPGQPEGGRYITVADDRGQVTFYSLTPRGYAPSGPSLSLGWALVDVAVGDVTGDGREDAVVIGYPSRLHLLRPR